MTQKLHLDPLIQDLIQPILKARKESDNDIELFLQRKYLKIPYIYMPFMMR